ncbi:hemicentin-1-like isoform X1 [Oculina patagonica]
MKNFHQLCLMKYFLLCSVSFLLSQGAPTLTDMEHENSQTEFLSATDTKCEIRFSCSTSSRCRHTKPRTVDPDSIINLSCAIFTGGLVQGLTWEQAKQAVQNSTGSDLVLQQSGNIGDSGKYSCQCTAIIFTRALQIVWVSSSPNSIIEGRPQYLECFFSGWPLPREVYWFKDGKPITNGTEGIYHSEDKKWKKGEETLRSRLRLPPGREEQEGYYKCSATNSIPSWSSSISFEIEMIYECKFCNYLIIVGKTVSIIP